jgi:hypothetical protein
MSDSPGFGKQLFGAVTDVIAKPSERNFTPVIFILFIGIAVGVLLLIVDVYYPFLPINPISGPSAVARQGKTFWSGITVDAQNLMVPSTVSPTQTADDYTVSIQILLQDSRTPSNGRYRHILHRGVNPCGLSVTQPGPTGHSNIQLSDIPDPEPSYAETGIPSFVNPGLFLDPVTNDLHMLVHTLGTDTAGTRALLLEGATVEDLPLNTPITIGVVLSGQSLEIYTNCRLYSTTLLRGKPQLPNKELTAWFGRACAFPFTGAVQNLALWSSALNSGDYLQVCRSGDFSKVNLTPVCPTAAASGSNSNVTVVSNRG